jgi:hypothetical protein
MADAATHDRISPPARAAGDLPFNDWMVDIETTGLRPDRAGILSIGAVQFDRRSFTPLRELFLVLDLPESRHWEAETRAWWMAQSDEAYRAAVDLHRGLHPAVALDRLAAAMGTDPWFWAKPLQFDYPFIEGYFRDFHHAPSPLHRNRSIDVRSWIASQGDLAVSAANGVPLIGTAHQPVSDCHHQVWMLRAAQEATRPRPAASLPPFLHLPPPVPLEPMLQLGETEDWRDWREQAALHAPISLAVAERIWQRGQPLQDPPSLDDARQRAAVFEIHARLRFEWADTMLRIGGEATRP